MAVNLIKGQRVGLRKDASDLVQVTIGLGCDTNAPGAPFATDSFVGLLKQFL